MGVLLLSALTFTPLVTPVGDATPLVAGIPHTLGAGILVAAGLVLLTYFGARVYPEDEEGRDG